MEVTEQTILVRQALYRFYAGVLLYPEPERLKTLRSGAEWLEQALEEWVEIDAGDAIETVRWVRELGPNDLEALRSEWVRLFGCGRDGYCYPYEGAYLGSQNAGALAGQLQREYARAGLTLAVNDLPDHVSVELEYMSYLCGLELETLHSGEDDRRARIVEAQRKFLEHHLTRWLPALCEQVVAAGGGRYADVCRAAEHLARREAPMEHSHRH